MPNHAAGAVRHGTIFVLSYYSIATDKKQEPRRGIPGRALCAYFKRNQDWQAVMRLIL